MLPLNHINDNSSKSNQMCLFQILDGEFPLRSVSSRMPRQIVGKAWNVRWLGGTKDPEEEWRFDWKGDERKGYTFAFASTTRLRQRLTAIRNPHETFRNSVTRLRSGSFLFFPLPNSCARCPVTAVFSIAQISRGNTGGQRRDVKLGQGNDPRRARVFYDTYQFSISNSIR